MPYFTPDEQAAAAVVLRTLEAELRKLEMGSELRSVLDDWALTLSTDPPGWVACRPRAKGL